MSSNKLAKRIRYALRFMPDDMYIQLNYFAHFKKFCDLNNPKTYNEKLNWLKLHDHNPLYTTLVDKYEVKKYVDEILGGGTQYRPSVYGTSLMKLILKNSLISLC